MPDQPIPSPKPAARPPRYFYGWVVVAVGFVTLLVSLGIRFTYSIFFIPLINEFGWDRASTSSIFSISLLLFAAVGPLLGHLLDHVGERLGLCGR